MDSWQARYTHIILPCPGQQPQGHTFINLQERFRSHLVLNKEMALASLHDFRDICQHVLFGLRAQKRAKPYTVHVTSLEL